MEILSTKFNSEFQTRMLSLAVQQPFFLASYGDVFGPLLFNSQYHKDIAQWVSTFYKKYKTTPTLTTMKKILRDNIPSSDPLFRGYKILVDQIYQTEIPDYSYIQDQVIHAARFQSVKNAMVRMTDMLDQGDFDALPSTLNNALQTGSGAGDLGLDMRENLEKSILMFDTLEQPVDVGFKRLQRLTGGFFPGELTAVCAPSGRGKTALLGAFSYGAARDGGSSMYYTLEIRDRRLLLRFYSRITKSPIKDLTKNIDKARRSLELFKLKTAGTTYVKFWPSSATTETVRSHLMKAHGLGIKPIAIFVDYADLLKPIRNHSDRRDLEITEMYNDLRSIGAEFNLHVFTATQAKTEAWHKEIIDKGDSSGSQGKETTVDNWMSINCTPNEEVARVGRIYVAKARMEASGRISHIAMDLDTMNIHEIDIPEYRKRMSKHGFKTTDGGRPLTSKRRKNLDESLDSHYDQ